MKKVHLTREQRYQIDALLQRKTKQKDIARIVGVSPSTISRELKRNSHKRGYSARVAQEYANERKEIKRRLDTDFYFADPYASYQRGTNENTNGLIRQYIPKNQDFTNINEQKIKQIQQKINARPRKKLNFETPLKL